MHQNSEESFGKVMDTVQIAEDMNIALDRVVKRSVYHIRAANDNGSVSNYYRINMYIPLLGELCNRFDNDRLAVLAPLIRWYCL